MTLPLRTIAIAGLMAGALAVPSPAAAVPEWLPAEPVAGGAARPLAIDLTPAGAMTLVWGGQANGSPAIIAGARPPGGPYAPPVPISTGTGQVGEPSLAVSPSGTAVAAWAQRNAAGSWIVQAAVRSPTGSWAPPVPLSAAAPADQEPVAAIADDGEILVAWTGPVVLIDAVQVVRRSPTGVWGATPADISIRRSSKPRLVMDGAGNATAVWLEQERATNNDLVNVVVGATRAAGGTWTLAQRLSPAPAAAEDTATLPHLAVGPDGRTSAIWYRWRRNRTESATRPLGGPWSGAELVGRPSFYDTDRPVVAVDAAGTTTATWSNGMGVEGSRRSATGTWPANTTVLSANVFPDAYAPVAAVAPSGLTLITWYSEELVGPAHLQAAVHAPGSGWSAAQELGALPARPWNVANAMDEQGNGVVVWSDTAGAIRSRTYDVGGPDLLDVSVPATATAGQPVAFSVTPRDRWSAVRDTTWDFGDGTAAGGAQAAHAFGAGTYTVRVRSADAHGNESTTARTLTVVPPPPPPPPPPRLRPSLAAGTSSLSAKFTRSTARGKPALKVAGTLSEASPVTFVLSGPLRPAGQRGDVPLGTLALPAGAFARELAVPASAVGKLLPGAYELRATGPEQLAATWRLKLAVPPEGVVLKKEMATSRTGPSLQAVTRAKQLWAVFEFLPEATTKRPLRARWYAPNRRKPIASFAVKGPRAYSYWRNARGLAKGRWRCELVAGKTVVDSVAIRVG